MPKPQREQSIAKQYTIWTKDMLTKYKKGDVPYTVPSWLKKYPKFNEKAITFIDKLQKGLESGTVRSRNMHTVEKSVHITSSTRGKQWQQKEHLKRRNLKNYLTGD